MSPEGTPDAIARSLPFNVPATLHNYLAGESAHWFCHTGSAGVASVMNVASKAEHEIFEAFPLVFKLIPVGRLKPLGYPRLVAPREGESFVSNSRLG
jgi:hypothetical protein